MSGIIYLIQENGQFMEMSEQEYDSEAILQSLLAKYPNLLAGEQIDSTEPRRWLLVSQEVPLPDEEDGAGRWSVDHLFLDQDAVPTIVEVKRSKDTRIRREVVGQMLDYAANAVVYWPVERIRAHFEATCQDQGQESEQVLLEFLDSEVGPEDFWQRMKTNLQAGKIRLLFVADKIPTELQRVVEFLNEQMDPAEVLALEVKQYMGQGVKSLVPRIIGQTAAALEKKAGGSREKKKWDEVSFSQDLELRRGFEDAQVARRILEWAQDRALRIWWGEGKKDGSFFPMFEYKGTNYLLISVWTYGRIEIQFQWLKTKPPFDQENKRRELLNRFNEIPGVSIPPDAITRRPSIRLSFLRDESVFKQFLGILDYIINEIRSQNL